MLDVDQLYKILTTEKSLLLANPQLAGGSSEELDERTVRKHIEFKVIHRTAFSSIHKETRR